MSPDSTWLLMANMQQANSPPFPFVPISGLSNLLTPKPPTRPGSRCVLAIRAGQRSHARQEEIYNSAFREICYNLTKQRWDAMQRTERNINMIILSYKSYCIGFAQIISVMCSFVCLCLGLGRDIRLWFGVFWSTAQMRLAPATLAQWADVKFPASPPSAQEVFGRMQPIKILSKAKHLD